MSMKIVKPSTSSEKQTRTTVDTVELTQKLVASWKSPSFQRALKINAKVMAVADEILVAGGVVPGILTIGVLDGETFVVDGQHRLAAWQQTGLDVGYADVRTHWFDSVGDMAKEFVRLNSSLVKLRPDDILRGMEPSTPALQRIRRKCGFVGYDMIRRSEKAPVLSMSAFIRSWAAAKQDVPQTGSSLEALATLEDDHETGHAIDFATVCYEAWHRDMEYARLWSALNMTLCGWLYRRAVMGDRLSAASRTARFSKEEFRKCLMALSAESQYLDYLVGRQLNDRDRAPAYSRVKAIFQRRHFQETGKSIKLLTPSWAHK
jgi:hypothetical protein